MKEVNVSVKFATPKSLGWMVPIVAAIAAGALAAAEWCVRDGVQGGLSLLITFGSLMSVVVICSTISYVCHLFAAKEVARLALQLEIARERGMAKNAPEEVADAALMCKNCQSVPVKLELSLVGKSSAS